MRWLRSIAVLGLVVGAAVCACAQEKGKAVAQADPDLLRQILAADRNNDGVISSQEFDGVGGTPLWAMLDTNRDRVLTRDEVVANLPAFLTKRAASGVAPRNSTGLVPLCDLGTGTYKGKPGGLYPDGKNERPTPHEAAGLKRAREIRALDVQGQPAPTGKVVLLSIGMSNTTQEFSTFKAMADADPARNSHLVIVDGAQGAMTAALIAKPDAGPGLKFWTTVDERLQQAGVARDQVEIVWIKEADAAPKGTDLEHAVALEKELITILQILKLRFPDLKLCYLSSRIYGGYASTALNPEPYAYEEGFAVKWLIEKQLAGDPEVNFDATRGAVKAPWLAWGPYLWADGTRPRSDGLTYDRADLRADDGTHPSRAGRTKVARQLLDFFKHDSTARIWFLRAGKPS